MTRSGQRLRAQPRGWAQATLGEVVTFEYGKALTRRHRDSTGGVPVYGSNGVVGYHSTPLVQRPCLIIGRKGAIGRVHRSSVPCWPIDTTYYVVPPKGLDLGFLHYLLSALGMQALDRSTAIPGLNRDDAYALFLWIPPTGEQQRIVAKIEELFSQLDAGAAALQKAKAQLQRYRQAVLKAAVTGELTREWREAHKDELEPASVLLERILGARTHAWLRAEMEKLISQGKEIPEDRVIGRYHKPEQVDGSALPPLPDGWIWTNLDTLTHYTVDYRGKTPPPAATGIPVISAANVRHGEIVIREPRFVSEETYANWLTRGRPKPDDLIVTTEAPVGEVALYPGDGRYLLTRRVIAFQTSHVNNRFLMYCFWGERTRKHLELHSRGTTVPRILKPRLLATPLPLPPLEEQQRVVSEVDETISGADSLERAIDQALKRANGLRQSILKSAFEGKLVPQDPADEPASALLERIKADKATGRAGKKARGAKHRNHKVRAGPQLELFQ